MIINGAIRMQMGHVEFNCHSFFLCVHLTGWSSRCAVRALAPTEGLINAFFFVARSRKDPHRIFRHIGQDKRAIPLLSSLCWEYVANSNMICVYQKKITIIAAFITIGGGLFVSDIHLHISFMASIIVVWSWITIHVFSGTNVKKHIEDLKLDMAGKWALRLGSLIEFIGTALAAWS